MFKDATAALSTLLSALQIADENTRAMGYVVGAVFNTGPNHDWQVVDSNCGCVTFRRMSYPGFYIPGQDTLHTRRVAIDGSLRDPNTLLPSPLPFPKAAR